ncbi:phosphoribosylformylglycinamidine cyclo-ligase [Sphaerochaeta sp. PS]|uniref:phosphoribosylformylglycinamidine cyclo-ligase n=1 Tax=Sphaerochaeta sp. PS TaxID=3076336 RepID=UPI0028A41234|nr:phosphoribosylformylglycinamidine cyclo-ligase [Sphaerochaeta sp. PS]MDT4761330.1 phosphoribosylformylglycinamidine cyclo-ligase [Sphaerochaeta sp. PS]
MTEETQNESYRSSGVDIESGYRAVSLMKSHVARTFTSGVRSDIGGFGGLFELDVTKTPHPILVCGTDGVGTKLKLAFLMDRHDTVGIDCVAMCVNDVICCGAEPQVFLDYIALGKLVPEKVEAIVKGVAAGCIEAGCALIGGETAEMPGFYPIDEYDLAGFTVGVVDKTGLFDNTAIVEGDLLVALPSSGVHSNGFSLVRKVFGLDHDFSCLLRFEPSLGRTLGEALLEPTTIYVRPLLDLAKKVTVKAAAHITGGGFYENIPRCLPKDMHAKIYLDDVRVLPLFTLIQQKGSIPLHDMYNTFNMGVGMVLVLDGDSARVALSEIEGSYVLGTVAQGEGGVVLL